MQVLRKYRFLIVGILWLCICQSCTKKKAIATLNPQNVLIDANFTSQSINERVLVCTNLSEKDLNRKDLKAWIRKNAVTVSQKKEEILLGPYRQYPEAWFYTQIINTDNLSHNLVVDEFNHIRCDAFEIITFKDGTTKNWGSITRSTPFSDYQIPFLTYAIPISIPPKDTLNLLIHTQRNYGNHQVNLGVSTYKTYLSEHIYHFLSKILQVIVFIICILMMFILGGIFGFKTMTYFSFYIISFLFVILSSWGFVDSILNFTGIGLSKNNVATFAVFVLCAFGHPFNIELMKPVPKNERLFKTISYILMGHNILVACCFLLPVSMFLKVNAYFYIPQQVLISMLIGITWLLFCSLMALFKAKIYYIAVGYGIAFLPYLIQQLISFFGESPSFLSKIYQPAFIFLAIGFTIICIYLLFEQLVTRKNHEKNLTQLKKTMEGIRKSEVETIGRNLHDQVGNTLASALGYLNLKTLKVDLVQKLIMDAINDIRFLSHNLVKDEDKPLTEKLEALVSRFNDFSTINFQYSDFSNAKINSLEPLNQQNIYMIVQEIMTNIIKHSKASEAYIQIFENKKNIAINIEDDGIGMVNLNESKGIGLKNIQKRVEVSKLKITTDSTPNGTNFIIEIPYENPNSNH
jgi:signal transduction histidine kinase